MKSDFQVPREIEATLVICSEDSQVVARKIAALTSIANYGLLPQDSKRIHDLYFDTLECALQAQKLALRIREVGSMRWITLKGSSQPTDWGGVERLEIEELWSKNALTRVVRELRDKRIKMLWQHQDFNRPNPLDVMASLGLKVIQDRETHRQVRNIVFGDGKSSPVLAELAIDSVVYHFVGREVCHYEVEIESKAKEGLCVLRKIKEGLVEKYKQVLREWKYGKLPTGKAIEKLLGEGSLEELLDFSNNLKPVAYDKIDEYLKKD
jgi:inorganic triphosphatase YgiF